MKVLIVNKFLHTVGGSETYCFALEKILEAHGHKVIWFSMKSPLNEPRENSDLFVNEINYYTKNPFKKLCFAIKYLYSFEAKRKISKLINKEKPDLVHLNLVHHQITLSIINEIKKQNIPIVWTLHDLVGICPNYLMLNNGVICEKCLRTGFANCVKSKCVKNSFFKSLLATIEAMNYKKSKVYSKVDIFITPSFFYKEKYIEGGFGSDKIVYMPNLLEPKTEYKAIYDRKDYVFYFGRLSKEKGIMTLIKAMKNVDYQLLIAGQGNLRHELEKYVIQNDLKNKVSFLGFKSGNELKKLINEAKCVVLPSEWYENGPYSIMEAMAVGTPIIASKVGGLPEIVENDKNGYLFKMGDCDDLENAINKIFSLSKESYRLMCEESASMAREKFSAENYYSHLIKIYGEIIYEQKSIDI